MTKIYAMKVSLVVMVMAEDANDANIKMQRDWIIRDAVNDSPSDAFEVSCLGEVRKVEHLKDYGGDWDGRCLPYGGDNMTRLNEILP